MFYQLNKKPIAIKEDSFIFRNFNYRGEWLDTSDFTKSIVNTILEKRLSHPESPRITLIEKDGKVEPVDKQDLSKVIRGIKAGEMLISYNKEEPETAFLFMQDGDNFQVGEVKRDPEFLSKNPKPVLLTTGELLEKIKQFNFEPYDSEEYKFFSYLKFWARTYVQKFIPTLNLGSETVITVDVDQLEETGTADICRYCNELKLINLLTSDNFKRLEIKTTETESEDKKTHKTHLEAKKDLGGYWVVTSFIDNPKVDFTND